MNDPAPQTTADPSSYDELLADALDATEGAAADLSRGGVIQALSGLHRAVGRCEEILQQKEVARAD